MLLSSFSISSSTIVVPTTITLIPVSEKLVHTDHTLWRAQVLAVLRSAQLDSFLEGTAKSSDKTLKVQQGTAGEVEDVPNPAYLQWQAQEQQVLSYLLTSVSRKVLVQAAALPTTAEVWRHIDSACASHSHQLVINTRMALATAQKGTSSAAEYVAKMKTLGLVKSRMMRISALTFWLTLILNTTLWFLLLLLMLSPFF
jgi:hypothetical protein